MQYLSNIILMSVICAFVGFGFQRMMDPDMIFAWYRKWLERTAGKGKVWYYITKPLGRCIICNTTWIGMICSFIVFSGDLMLFSIIVVGVCSAGMVVMIENKFRELQN